MTVEHGNIHLITSNRSLS